MVNSPVDEIKSRLDIVDVIRGYIKLQKAGVNFKALCPFHNEKTPSFFVSPSRQIWHCFGCGAGGDMFSFVMKIEGCEFRDALRILANKAGVKLGRVDPKLRTEREKLYEICSAAENFFEERLKEYPDVRKYLLNRGFEKETIFEFHLGWAPPQWRSLGEFLSKKGYRLDDIARAGLIINKKGGNEYYDRFRSRIIFPIFDLQGEIIGFGGRIFQVPDSKRGRGPLGTLHSKSQVSSENIAKYINTPQSLIYDKSKVLYGLDKAKTEIRRNNQCIIVEGYTDVIASHQAGVKNVVSASGTALTEGQLRILKRYGESLILAFDQDSAGQEATKRGINRALSFGFDIKILPMPEGKDPADFIKENPKGWRELIGEAQGIIDFYFKDAFFKISAKDVEGKKKIAKILLPVLKRIPNKIEQAYWLRILSQKLSVEEKFLVEAMNLVKTESFYHIREGMSNGASYRNQDVNQTQTETKSKVESLEERLLGFLLLFPEKVKEIDKDLFTKPSFIKIFRSLKNYQAKNFSFDEFQKELSSDLSIQARLLTFKAEKERETKDFDVEKELIACIEGLKNEKLRRHLKQLSLGIRKAEENKDKVALETLTKEFNKISKELTSGT